MCNFSYLSNLPTQNIKKTIVSECQNKKKEKALLLDLPCHYIICTQLYGHCYNQESPVIVTLSL